jgi:hypothetical protein
MTRYLRELRCWSVGYYAEDAQWHVHTFGLTETDAEDFARYLRETDTRLARLRLIFGSRR